MPASSMNVLIIGGSGFLSGTLARRALAAGHAVWCVTRGRRPLAPGVTALVADRRDPDAFAAAVRGAGVRWDLAVDCIAFEPADTAQDAA
jgi:2'-hydroxyisoflavone reductase